MGAQLWVQGFEDATRGDVTVKIYRSPQRLLSDIERGRMRALRSAWQSFPDDLRAASRPRFLRPRGARLRQRYWGSRSRSQRARTLFCHRKTAAYNGSEPDTRCHARAAWRGRGTRQPEVCKTNSPRSLRQRES